MNQKSIEKRKQLTNAKNEINNSLNQSSMPDSKPENYWSNSYPTYTPHNFIVDWQCHNIDLKNTPPMKLSTSEVFNIHH